MRIRHSGIPDIDYLIKIKFVKKESGIESISSESVDDENASTYDLQGRIVDAETASPGIYIRSGKKIVIK